MRLAGQAEPYRFDHVELNRRPGSTGRPQTEWLNMGFWRDTDSFPVACEALARKVLDAAQLKAGGHHLDVAHGSGDSLLLVLDTSGSYPSQTSVTGITSMAEHARRARERVDSLPSKPTANVRLVAGDAIYRPYKQDVADGGDVHPFADPQGKRYDSIIVLDAAYHFETRETFLSQAYNQLAPGGTLALGDIVSSSHYPQSSPDGWSFMPSSLRPPPPSAWASRISPSALLAVPAVNLLPIPDLAAQLLALGFEAVAVEDVSDAVFPGFARFLRSRGWLWGLFGGLIEWFGKGGGLRWVIVSARKPGGE